MLFRRSQGLARILEPIPHRIQRRKWDSRCRPAPILPFWLTKKLGPRKTRGPQRWTKPGGLGSHLMMVMSLMQNSYAPAALVLAGTWNWMPSIFAGLKATVLVPGGLMSAHMIVLTMFALTGDGL